MTTARVKAHGGTAWRRTQRCALLGAAAACFALMAQAAQAAASCTISVTGVNFGAYDVFSSPSAPNDSGVGSLRMRCTDAGSNTFPVTLSTGQSGSYAARTMNSGPNFLTYNLYTSAARSVVWGDGVTGGTGAMSAGQGDTTLPIYGRIPGGQDAAVGAYSDDTITATVTF